MFGSSIGTGNIAANINGSNCDHESCVEDELLSNCNNMSCVEDELISNCGTKEKVDDETNFDYDISLLEDESVRLCCMNFRSLDFVNHDHTCQLFCPENDFCDVDSAQESTFKDMMGCSGSNKSSEFQKNWLILSDRLSYVLENIPTCITYTPSQSNCFKRWKAKQGLCHASNCNTPCRDNNDKYYGIQHGLKKDFEPHIDISATYLWSQDDAKYQSNKNMVWCGYIPIWW